MHLSKNAVCSPSGHRGRLVCKWSIGVKAANPGLPPKLRLCSHRISDSNSITVSVTVYSVSYLQAICVPAVTLMSPILFHFILQCDKELGHHYRAWTESLISGLRSRFLQLKSMAHFGFSFPSPLYFNLSVPPLSGFESESNSTSPQGFLWWSEGGVKHLRSDQHSNLVILINH
jgi:hypothetical protein